MYDLLNRVGREMKSREDSVSILIKISQSLLEYEKEQSFESVANIVFTLNVFAKIDQITEDLTSSFE